MQSYVRELVEGLQKAFKELAESGGEWWRAGRKIFEKSQKVGFLKDSFDISVNSFSTPCRFFGHLRTGD